MWTCAKCSAEVEDNFLVCWQCGTALASQGPGAPAAVEPSAGGAAGMSVATADAPVAQLPRLVSLATYWVPGQAREVQGLLQADGVFVCIAPEAASADWFLNNGHGRIDLQVADVDLDRAKRVLLDHPRETTPLPPPAEPAPAPAPEQPFRDEPWKTPLPADLSPQEVLRTLLSRFSALMDSKDTPDWKINPAFHPEVMAFIQSHSNNNGFVQKAQGLQQNRAKYFAAMRARSEALRASGPMTEPQPERAAAPEGSASAAASEPAAPAAANRLVITALLWLLRKAALATFAIVAGLVLALAVAVVGRGYGQRQLEQAIAEADEKDPNWTWKSLQANRKELPDNENAAVVVAAVAPLLPDEVFLKEDWVPKGAWTAEDFQRTDRIVAAHEQAVEQARSLKDFLTGRYPATEPPADFSDLDPFPQANVNDIMKVYRLLALDAIRQVRKGQPEQAIASARAACQAARSVGDEPSAFAQQNRLYWSWRTARLLGFLLAGERSASAQELLKLQATLSDEEKHPHRLYVMRGRRALKFALGEALDRGDLALLDTWNSVDFVFELRLRETPYAPAEFWLRGGVLKSQRAVKLRQHTEQVEIAKLPLEQQLPRLRELLWPNQVAVIADEYLNHQVELRCAVAAVAVERYRLASNEWPTRWEQLVPTYLPAVPIDPYDGQPLRLRRADEGVVIYSVGLDGKDDAGRASAEPGTFDAPASPDDLAFRLFDVERRVKANGP